MKKPFIQSVVIHLLVVVLIIISGWSIFSRTKTDIPEQSVTVELLPISQKTNIKPREREKKSAEKTKKVEEKKPEKKPEKEKDEPKKEEPKPSPIPSDKAKPTEKEKKKEKTDDELKSLLKDLDKSKPTGKEDVKEQKSPDYDPSQPLSVSELNYLQNLLIKQLKQCWNVPAGARDAEALIVSVDIDIERDGSIKFIGFEDETKYGSNPYYQVAADAARRAVLDPRCNPLKELPPKEKYEKWHEVTIEFDPSKLLN